MRLLWVATKSPWPAVDGGRLLMRNTLAALAAQGHLIHLIAPGEGSPGAVVEIRGVTFEAVAGPRRSASFDLARATVAREPWTIRRHRRPELRSAAERALARGGFDAVVAEQLQAVAQLPDAAPGRPPRILRAQNVESDLWRFSGRLGGWRRPFLLAQARRLEEAERGALIAMDATAALTHADALRLRAMAGGRGRVEVLPAPFLPLAPSPEPLPGSPAVVVLAGGGWAPNRDATRWFLEASWPLVRARSRGAQLHVFGGDEVSGPGVSWRPAPAESGEAFRTGSVFLVPLRIGSGVRMKILEAWARGVPVVTTPQGAAGLECESGRDLLIGEDGAGLAEQIERLDSEVGLRAALVAGGNETLRRHHDPHDVAAAWKDLLESLIRR